MIKSWTISIQMIFKLIYQLTKAIKSLLNQLKGSLEHQYNDPMTKHMNYFKISIVQEIQSNKTWIFGIQKLLIQRRVMSSFLIGINLRPHKLVNMKIMKSINYLYLRSKVMQLSLKERRIWKNRKIYTRPKKSSLKIQVNLWNYLTFL